MRAGIVRAMLIWLVLSVVGGAIVALPDDGSRVFTISETHGPSAIDLAGVLLLLLGWLVFLTALWRSRRAIGRPALLGAVCIAAAGVVAWSVLTDAGWWWLPGVAVLAGAQVWAGVSAARARVGRSAA